MDTDHQIHAIMVLVTFSLFFFFISPSPTTSTPTPPNAPSRPIHINVCNISWPFINNIPLKWNSTLCEQILTSSNPRAASAPDYLTLGQIILESGKDSASNFNTHFNKLLLDSNVMLIPGIKRNITVCADSYGALFFIFENALRDLLHTKPHFSFINVGIDTLDACVKTWNATGVNDPILSQENVYMTYFIATGAWITHYLATHRLPAPPPPPKLLV